MAEPRRKTLEELRTDAKKAGPTTVRPRKKEKWWHSLLYAAIIALVIRSFFIEAFRIPTGSMKNSLLVGDHLFVNKLSYYFKTPKYIPFTAIEIPHLGFKTFEVQRGDIVVFEYPGDRDLVEPREKNVNYIKRCVGLPGDSVEVRDKQVYVNGVILPNPEGLRYNDKSFPKDHPDPGGGRMYPKGNETWNRDWYGPIRIPKQGDVIDLTPENFQAWEVFIKREGHTARLGDQGTIIIDGMPASKYTVERDYLWMMGDNRDASEDSRYWGFCPYENVVGSALFIYWSMYNPPGQANVDGYDEEEVQSFKIRWNRLFNAIR
jgi:signal peptidase I